MAYENLYNFSGKVAFVTGGATGIGQATAMAFGAAGAWVAIADINEDDGLKTVKMIQDAGGEALFFKCDFGNLAATEYAIHSVIKKTGRIDVALNNAGIEGDSATTADCSSENWHRVIDVNLRGVWLCMKHEIHVMLKQGGGTIVNMSSIAGLSKRPKN
jgi:NAD(P)-dependent dehydrogenase (short-subunit alcohol dehydrogenase family)